MSETRTIPAAATDAEAASQFLMLVVLGLQALAVNGKQAHWNVRGENFVAIHELIDTIVGNAQTGADHAAERIVALGLPIDARVGTVAAKTATRVAAGFTQWDGCVRALIADIDVVIRDTQAAIDGLDGVDLPSQDVAIGIMQTLEKDRWFLFAHVAE